MPRVPDHMNEQQRAMYTQILSNPAYRVKPEWTHQAIMEWLYVRMNHFLIENPDACRHVAKVDHHRLDVQATVPITDEYKDIILYLLRTVPNNGYRYDVIRLCDRLVEHGRADLIAEVSPDLLGDPHWVTKYIDKMSPDALMHLLLKIKFDNHNGHVINRIIHLIQQEDLMAVLPHIMDNIKAIHPVPILTMLKRLPIESAQRLAAIWGEHRSSYECMRCGRATASTSGYTLHRKKCDPMNEYPPVKEIIAQRLAEEKQAIG